MTAFFGDGALVYLLAVLRKGDRENFSAAEVAQMMVLTMQIKRTATGAKRR